jgi:hypothetical protein
VAADGSLLVASYPCERARVLVWLGPNLPEPAHSTPLVVRAGTLPDGSTFLLLRRLDVPEDPLLALRVAEAANVSAADRSPARGALAGPRMRRARPS